MPGYCLTLVEKHATNFFLLAVDIAAPLSAIQVHSLLSPNVKHMPHVLIIHLHAGTCPSCPRTVQLSCHCGRSKPLTKRCGHLGWSCGRLCGRVLSCQLHTCELRCHEGNLILSDKSFFSEVHVASPSRRFCFMIMLPLLPLQETASSVRRSSVNRVAVGSRS